jgi:hypothetical protein
VFSRGGLPPNNKPRKVVVPQNPAFETGGFSFRKASTINQNNRDTEIGFYIS